MKTNLFGRRKSVAITALVAALCLLLISPSSLHVNSRASAQSGSGEATPKKSTPTKKSTPAPKRTTPPRRTTGRTTSQPSNSGATDDTAANERTYWESIRESRDPEDFRAYLRKYPNGQFADLARNRIRSLEAANSSTSARATSVPRAGAIIRNQMGMEFAYVPAGTFMMGSPAPEAQRSSDEGPQRRVTVQQFYMGKYEVTQAQYKALMGTNPSNFKGCDDCPVEQVSWSDAQEFIRRLNARGDGYTYRLPTEAEWEYACRAGTTTPFAFGSILSSDQANFDGNYPYGGAAKGVYRQKTTAVGSFQPNGWGLYDMHGNVWEWCEDWYHVDYNGAPNDGSAWLSGGEQKYRVLRGGSWGSFASFLRSAYRYRYTPDYRNVNLGFRVVALART